MAQWLLVNAMVLSTLVGYMITLDCLTVLSLITVSIERERERKRKSQVVARKETTCCCCYFFHFLFTRHLDRVVAMIQSLVGSIQTLSVQQDNNLEVMEVRYGSFSDVITAIVIIIIISSSHRTVYRLGRELKIPVPVYL